MKENTEIPESKSNQAPRILCAGMIRSGSTWSFNVCRMLALLKGKALDIPVASRNLDYTGLEEFLANQAGDFPGIALVKVHRTGPLATDLVLSGRIKNICTIRDPRDCVASLKLFEDETFTFHKSLFFIRQSLGQVDIFRQSSHTLFIRYEEMINDAKSQIRCIADYLEVEVDDETITQIDTATDMTRSKKITEDLIKYSEEELLRVRSHLVDSVTNLHEGHIQGGIQGRWETEFTDDERDTVVRELKPWLISLGYETERSIAALLG